ncbi:MAG: hypothetical protein PUJ51_25320 [Clostridiales bacterium]|uniref:hypothetical protein n=1 Tax=Terrisporobacter sp. TaxID=1965305 RepID=UPI002A581B93|nr:hypothetical protein [Terrisporobacter sp.]MDD7757780.1 hypothetical protein [Clostridiales bacterium]MDY4135173.1 hypothetical protein [Terrisporobacter sp.]
MEALSVGMYVRTLNGIVKIDKIQDNVMEDTKGHLHYGDFIKASYKITDILEEGDYVNGCKVIDIVENDIYISNFYAEQCIDIVTIKNIKSIVTKEQFESMSYKVSD